ncbi:hypothetical protein [Bacillus toyonensis]|uniref:hypothetical protein n=1 Tax=Bacillus toyonensis TaxID=155322 RepID=UPI002E23C17B|nr:hypothetical protein [Bacillus toyonensis]
MGKFENERKYVTEYNGTNFEYSLEGSFVSITRNGKFWGVPQGDRFFRALLADIEILLQENALLQEKQQDQYEHQVAMNDIQSKNDDLIRMNIKVMFPNRTVKEFSFDELKLEDNNSFCIGTIIGISSREPKYMIKNITIVRDGTITLEVY